MDKWTELRTAYQVAKLGTVSAAADAMGLHRATVNRHIDALEAELGARVFLRHAKGYALTELGEEVLRTAQKTEELIDGLVSRAHVNKAHIEGDIKITTLAAFSRLLMRPIADFRLHNPGCRVIVSVTEDLEKLEHGEAHVALRAGSKPSHPDYIVQLFKQVSFNLYAHDTYVSRYGLPRGVEGLERHQFVLPSANKGPQLFNKWIEEHVAPQQIALSTSDMQVKFEAIAKGLGLGFLSDVDVTEHSGFHPVLPVNKAWSASLWLVTHVDVHRTAKVQALLRCLKKSGGDS